MEYIPTNIPGLDELLNGGIKQGSLVLIAGNPGTGKTTLASTIMASASSMGIKGLYVSLTESERDYLNHMESLGLNLKEWMEKNLFSFIDAAFVASDDAVVDLLSYLYNYIIKNNIKIITIDSITAILQIIKDEARTRELVRNFFSKAMNNAGMTVIAVSELPMGKTIIGTGVEEFIADAIIILKSEMIHNRLTRYLEIRKARWAPLLRVRVPFRIVPGKPIEVYIPEKMPEVPPPKVELRYLFSGCKILMKHDNLITLTTPNNRRITESELEEVGKLSPLPPGIPIVVHYSDPAGIAGILASICLFWNDNERITILSTRIPKTFIEETVNACIGKPHLVTAYNINPTFYTAGEIHGLVRDIIEIEKPGLFIFEGVDLLELTGSSDEVIDLIYNLSIWMRHHSITPIYIYYSKIPELLTIHAGVHVNIATEPFDWSTRFQPSQLMTAAIKTSNLNIKINIIYNINKFKECVARAIESLKSNKDG